MGMETQLMTNSRRTILRRAVLFTFGAVLGKFDILKAQGNRSSFGRGPGQLTVDLAQWGGIVFKHGGRSVTVSMAEVFNALSQGSTT